MLKLAIDENVDGRVVRGLLVRVRGLDLVRVQDVGLRAAHDRDILAWSAAEDRVLLTHDVRTMTGFAAERIRMGEPVAGVVILPRSATVGPLIEALQELIGTHQPEEFRDRILYLKL